MKENQQNTRIIYLDVLRVVSTFAVMVIHLAATGFWEAVPGSYEWTVCLIYNSITRFAVPVFVMISGAMYLDPQREITMTHIFKKLRKLLVTFFFWSFLYALAESLEQHALFSAGYFASVIEKTVTGHYHMWYICMIAGLYLATPFLRPIAADRKLLRMFLCTVFLLNFCTRFLRTIPGWEETVVEVMNKADIGIFSGYTGYYCLGYYLHSENFSKKETGVLSAVMVLLTAAAVVTCIFPDNPAAFFAEKMPHIFIYSTAVFLLFKRGEEKFIKSSRLQNILSKIVPCTFGMYLIHPVFNLLLRKAGLYALTFNPLFSIPLCSLLVCLASFGVISCMRKIPWIKHMT